MPHGDSACMNTYLSELVKVFVNDKIALIMDQVEFILSPYSPDLPPVEKLFLHIK
ncbi:hypothetical protein K737_300665 [Holospora undulata HU1]|uniref:Uncharacterized protein n=1 Tax=Holospora undulata HU1 TaxID=1321371 RepID=A0A061JG64_9PROT|nr:hypothetical protein K737_300665 [Holospora undulata HU1]